MANIKVKDADAADKYLAASGAGTDVDPHVAQHEVTQATPDDLNANANLQVGDVDVGAGNPVPVDATGQGDVPVTLDGEAVTIQDGGGAITVDGTVAVTDGGGSLTVDGSVSVDDGAGSLTVDDGGVALAVDATGQGDVPVTLDSEVVAVDATGQGDVPITLDGESVAVTGSVALAPATSGGLAIFRSIDLDESEEAVKTSAGQLFGFYLYNDASSGKRYVKLYDDTVANVVVGTTTPVLTIPLDAGQGAVAEFANGIAFANAITIAATTGIADADTGAPGANEVVANVFYK